MLRLSSYTLLYGIALNVTCSLLYAIFSLVVPKPSLALIMAEVWWSCGLICWLRVRLEGEDFSKRERLEILFWSFLLSCCGLLFNENYRLLGSAEHSSWARYVIVISLYLVNLYLALVVVAPKITSRMHLRRRGDAPQTRPSTGNDSLKPIGRVCAKCGFLWSDTDQVCARCGEIQSRPAFFG